jgi:hypothetical protein
MYLQKNCKCVYCLKDVITHLSAATVGLLFTKCIKIILSAENKLIKFSRTKSMNPDKLDFYGDVLP